MAALVLELVGGQEVEILDAQHTHFLSKLTEREWNLARVDAAFFELRHPITQRKKHRRILPRHSLQNVRPAKPRAAQLQYHEVSVAYAHGTKQAAFHRIPS